MTDFNSTNSDIHAIDDIEFLDTSDIQPVEETDIDDGNYHATKMSPEEIKRIDDLWKEPEDVDADIEPYRASSNSEIVNSDIIEPYRAKPLSDTTELEDLSDASDSKSIEESFALDIESTSIESINDESENLEKLSRMNDKDILAEYRSEGMEKYDPELFNALTDGLSKKELEHLKEGLASGDKDVYEYFGLNSDGNENDSEGFARVRRL